MIPTESSQMGVPNATFNDWAKTKDKKSENMEIEFLHHMGHVHKTLYAHSCWQDLAKEIIKWQISSTEVLLGLKYVNIWKSTQAINYELFW